MSETENLFSVLRESADKATVDALRQHVEKAPDRSLVRINALAFAANAGLDEETVIAAFLHASVIGIFDMSWNVLCPGCGGVLETAASLKTMLGKQKEYGCALCGQDYAPTLDEMVEVTFTVNSRARRIAAHSPDTLPVKEYLRQIYWGSGVDLPGEGYEELLDEMLLEVIEVQPGEKAVLSLLLPAKWVLLFEPVTHVVQVIDANGEPTQQRQSLSVTYDRAHVLERNLRFQPGPLRIAIENRTDMRLLPALFIADDPLHHMLAKRRPFLTATRLLTNQTFRDLHRTDTLSIDQRLKITSLTFLFSDLRGSTELYERVGDLVAFDMVNAHFKAIGEIVASEAGAVVKTIGDAVMATFPTPDRALAAALRMREAMAMLNSGSGHENMVLKIGIHEGPCIAVSQNEQQDYFGQTVNIAARVQKAADAQAIFATKSVVEHHLSVALIADKSLALHSQMAVLRGIDQAMSLYSIG